MQINKKISCGTYSEASQSEYALPYLQGAAYTVSQGNCSSFSHTGSTKYSYDFSMVIGTPIVAIRGGVVVDTEERYIDGNGESRGFNFVYIEHADKSVAGYLHLKNKGSLVYIGQTVDQGQMIAYSGSTGWVTGPHLHLVVWKNISRIESMPISFSNSEENHDYGLQTGASYTAK